MHPGSSGPLSHRTGGQVSARHSSGDTDYYMMDAHDLTAPSSYRSMPDSARGGSWGDHPAPSHMAGGQLHMGGVSTPRPQQAPPRDGQIVLTWTSKQLKGLDANYNLYFLVPHGDSSRARVCAVGVDSRKSGHYSYSATLPGVPALNVTNQAAVRKWMGDAFGPMESSTRDEVLRLPQFSEDDVRAMVAEHSRNAGASSARSTQSRGRGTGCNRKEPAPTLYRTESGRTPMFPPDIMTGWTDVEEIKERHPDGRKRIHFILKDASNPDRQLTVITADESRPSDRRYSYKASPELGGYSFKNRTVAVEWVQHYFLTSSLNDPLALATPSESRDLGNSSARSLASDTHLYLSPADMSEVEAAFHGDAGLLHWAIEPVSAPQLQQYERWAAQLTTTNYIQHAQPVGVPAFQDHPERCAQGLPTWTSIAEAHSVLSQLQAADVPLQLLEQSGITTSVASLRNHSDERLAALAGQLAAEWRTKAQRSLQFATAALQAVEHT